jgi:hypothetical protein
MIDGLLRVVALCSGAMLLLRSRRPPSEEPEMYADPADYPADFPNAPPRGSRPDPLQLLWQQVATVGPPVLLRWIEAQQSERAAAVRLDARAAAHQWRELGLRFAQDKLFEQAARCEAHAVEIERDHGLLGREDPEPDGEGDRSDEVASPTREGGDHGESTRTQPHALQRKRTASELTSAE